MTAVRYGSTLPKPTLGERLAHTSVASQPRAFLSTRQTSPTICRRESTTMLHNSGVVLFNSTTPHHTVYHALNYKKTTPEEKEVWAGLPATVQPPAAWFMEIS